MKTCNGCKEEKPLSEYHNRTLPSGKRSVANKCKVCMKIRSQQRYIEKADHIKEVNKQWRDQNKDYYHKRFQQNKDLYLSWLRAWAIENPGKMKAKDRRRKVRNKLAFVPWADLDKINIIYKVAKELTEQTGIPHHVDHIIPLQGKLVSGLHVDYNLAVIPAKENLIKGNKYGV